MTDSYCKICLKLRKHRDLNMKDLQTKKTERVLENIRMVEHIKNKGIKKDKKQ